MLNPIEGIDDLPSMTVAERVLADTLKQLEKTLNNLRLNHPEITQSEMDRIAKYVNASMRKQIVVDKKECEYQMQGYNPLEDKPSSFIVPTTPSTYKINTVKTGGASRKLMEFVTSERHAIGIYKRCVYEIERMDEAVDNLKKMPTQSKQNHKKVQLLNSYTKHYYRFKNDYGMLLRFNDLHGKLEKEFESSHDVRGKSEWRQDLEHWETPGYPWTPATYQREYNIHP